MTPTLRRILGLAFLASAAAAPAQAGPVIFDNGAAVGSDGLASDFDAFFPAEAADDFTLAAAASVIGDVHWWGFYFTFVSTDPVAPSAPDDFSIRIFADDGGSPANAAPLHDINVGDVGRTAFGGAGVFEFSTTISPISLTPGTYWLSIVNDTDADSSADWGWSFSSATTGNVHQRLTNWTEFDAALAFNLTGPDAVTEPPADAVPEPSVLVLLGAGLAGLGLVTRRRRGRVGGHRAV